jgi:hypothetical protein
MVLDKLPIERHDTQLLMNYFQGRGQLEALGPVMNYVNDPGRTSLPFYEAQLAPLTPASPLNTISQSQVVLLKSQITLMYFSEAETRESIRPLPNRELVVAYLPEVVCRGYFHMSAEASLDDFLDVTPGDLLPMTEVQIFPLIELPGPFPSQADLLLINPDYIEFYHSV